MKGNSDLPSPVDQRPRLKIVVPLILVCFAVAVILLRDVFRAPAKLQPAPSGDATSRPPISRTAAPGAARDVGPARPKALPRNLGAAPGAEAEIGPSSEERNSSANGLVRVGPAVSEQTSRPAGAALFSSIAQISGTTILRGTPPAETVIALDPSCGRLHANPLKTRFYVGDDNKGLADVFVYVKEGLGEMTFPTPDASVMLDQKGCEYVPYVLGLQVGQKLLVSNSDPLLHNVHPTPAVEGNAESNKAQPQGTRPFEYVFSQPESFLRIKCDVHNWMFAYVTVVPHPFFAVSDRHGRYALPKLPGGRYVIAAIHRKAGEQTREIHIQAEEHLELNFQFEVPTAEARK